MVQGLQWTVLLGVQVSIILASNGFQIYTVSLVRLQWYKKEWEIYNHWTNPNFFVESESEQFKFGRITITKPTKKVFL